jgi:8-oxo-dGTP pyrophosphatase MutT (NUDIX family)
MRKSNKERLARFIQRYPYLLQASQRIWRRFFPPWMTAGTIGALYNDDGQFLIVEHVFHPKFPWGFPGGWMNRGESPAETIIREVREETGLHIQVERPLLISSTSYLPNHLDIAFLCHTPGGEIRLSGELLDYRWVAPQDMPPLLQFHREVLSAAVVELKRSGGQNRKPNSPGH